MLKLFFASVAFTTVLLSCRKDEPSDVRRNDGVAWSCVSDASCEQYNFSFMTDLASEHAKRMLRVECPQMKAGACTQNYVEQCQHSQPTENSVGTTVYLYKHDVPKEVRLACRGDWKKL